jgi:hypothetical protein
VKDVHIDNLFPKTKWSEFCRERAPLRGMGVVEYANWCRALREDYAETFRAPPSRMLASLYLAGAWEP